MGKGSKRPRGRNRKGYCGFHKKWLTTTIRCGKEYDCDTCNHFLKVTSSQQLANYKNTLYSAKQCNKQLAEALKKAGLKCKEAMEMTYEEMLMHPNHEEVVKYLKKREQWKKKVQKLKVSVSGKIVA